MTEPTHKSAWTLGMPGCLGSILGAVIGGIFTLSAVKLQQKPCDTTNLNSNTAILVNTSNSNSYVDVFPTPTVSNSPLSPKPKPTLPIPAPEIPEFTPVVIENFRFSNFKCSRKDEIICTFGIENLAANTLHLQIITDGIPVSDQSGSEMYVNYTDLGGVISSYASKDIPNNLESPMPVELKLTSNGNPTKISEMKIKFFIVTMPQKRFTFTVKGIPIKF